MNSELHRDYDLVIVGAGAVGCLFAALLNQNTPELKIAIVEASADNKQYLGTAFDPKVMALSASSVQLLDGLNVWSKILKQRACAYHNMYVWDGENSGELFFNCKEYDREQLGFIVENSVIVKALHGLLKEATNVELIRPCSIKKIDSSTSPQELCLSDEQKISAQLIVGADGAQSQIRQMMGFETRQWSYGQHAIITTVETELSHQSTAWQRFSHCGPLALLPLNDEGERHFCSIVWSLNTDVAKQKYDLSDSEFCESLGYEFEHRLGRIVSTDKRYLIPLRQMHSIEYYKSSVVLLGDAAHTIHPLAGQGANLGFYDAKVLAAEIQRAQHVGLSINHPSVLKRFQRQRKIENTGAMLTMEALKRVFAVSSPLLNAYRGKGMSWVNNTPWLKSRLAALAAGPLQ